MGYIIGAMLFVVGSFLFIPSMYSPWAAPLFLIGSVCFLVATTAEPAAQVIKKCTGERCGEAPTGRGRDECKAPLTKARLSDADSEASVLSSPLHEDALQPPAPLAPPAPLP
jgi:hypothetical protein